MSADLLALHMVAAKIPYQREMVLVPGRRWRVDFLVDKRIVVEYEGGIWSKGRHVRPTGFLNDCEKYNTLTTLGYKVLRVAEPHVQSGEALKWIEQARVAA
jgi:very-short-patch-repair endonuclease